MKGVVEDPGESIRGVRAAAVVMPLLLLVIVMMASAELGVHVVVVQAELSFSTAPRLCSLKSFALCVSAGCWRRSRLRTSATD